MFLLQGQLHCVADDLLFSTSICCWGSCCPRLVCVLCFWAGRCWLLGVCKGADYPLMSGP
jgi:hypothetical protein